MSRDGTVHESEGRIQLRYERRIARPIDEVWRAITDPEELRRWWVADAEIELEPGGRYFSRHGHEGEFEVEDRVLEVDPPRLFEHTFWEHEAPRSVVRWELTPVDGGTLLVLTHTFGEDEVPDRARNAAGWHHLLDALEGRSGRDEDELLPRYRYLETKVDGRALRFERRLGHPLEKVWAALTEPDELIGWLAAAEVELEQGGRLTLRWQNSDDDGNQAVMHATITELAPPRLIEYEGEPHGRVRWELSDEDDGCLLRLTVTPPSVETEALAGWHIHLDHLEDALAGRPVDWSRWSEEHRPGWQELHERYKELRVGT